MKKTLIALSLFMASSAALACGTITPGPTTYLCLQSGLYTLAYRDVTVVTITTPGQYVVAIGTNNFHRPPVHFPRGGSRVLSYHATISSVQIFDINKVLQAEFVASASNPAPYDGVNYSETLTVHLEPGAYQLEVRGAVNGGVIGPIAHLGYITVEVTGPN
jgi:hypothetical protein